MAEFKMSRNASGYYDETAYKGIMEMAKQGEIWTYTNTNNTLRKFVLIIKNHGTLSTVLSLVDECNDDCIAVDTKYTDPRMIQYVFNSNLCNFVRKVSDEDFKFIMDEIAQAIGICLKEKEPHKSFAEVDHPSYYQGKHECIDEMIALFGVDAVKGFCKCNVHKYRYRAANKNGDQDMEKANWYMDKLIELEGGESE